MRTAKAAIGMILIVAAAAGGLYVTDHLLAAPEARVAGPGADPTVQVETIPLARASFDETIRAVGTARARQAVELTSEASGRITRIAFEPGRDVADGDVLLELDDRAVQADLKAAEATLAETQAALTRQEQLNRTGSASDAAYQTARAAMLRAEAERDRISVALEDRRVRAPFSGVIGLTDLVEGQMLDSQTVIATLDDLSVIEVDFSVSETYLPRLRTGQRIELTSAAWPGRSFAGQITRIDTRVDPATRSIALRAQIRNEDRALAGGMFLQVRLVLDERDGLAVPESALSAEGDRTLVLVAEDGVARQAEIRIGRQSGDLVEVLHGLAPDAQIIVTNLHRVQPGTNVEATARQPRSDVATGADAAGNLLERGGG